MGVVHLARRPGGERVALKVLRPHIVGDDEARARLAREVSSLSPDPQPLGRRDRRRRPVGRHPVRRHPLRARASRCTTTSTRRGRSTGDDLRWFARGLAEGLATVHEVGVLHRDVKPSNVLMEGRTPILIDFGLARVADDPKLTHTGWLLGTPGYLAPEILYGDDATAASDIHSWAATVAYAGTGRAAVRRAGRRWRSWTGSAAAQHDLSGLPGELREVVAAALDPDPRRRPTLPGAARLAARRAGPGARRRCRPIAPTTRTPCRWRWPRRRHDRTITIFDDDAEDAHAGATRTTTRGVRPGPAKVSPVAAAAARAAAAHRGRRGRRRRCGVPLAGARRSLLLARVGAAQRLARGQRDGRPAPAARGEVVRPGPLPRRRPVARRPARSPAPCCSRCGRSGSRSPAR